MLCDSTLPAPVTLPTQVRSPLPHERVEKVQVCAYSLSAIAESAPRTVRPILQSPLRSSSLLSTVRLVLGDSSLAFALKEQEILVVVYVVSHFSRQGEVARDCKTLP
jgi:hypothetical protein